MNTRPTPPHTCPQTGPQTGPGPSARDRRGPGSPGPASRRPASRRPGSPGPASRRPASRGRSAARLVLPGLVAAAALAGGAGCSCIPQAHKSVPAYRLPDLHCVVDRAALRPVDISLLGRKPPRAHVIGPGDTLSVYVYGTLPPNTDEAPVVAPTGAINQEYYPPLGQADLPALGVPVRVDVDGSVSLPSLGSVDVNGLTSKEAREKILGLYLEGGFLAEDEDRVAVSVLKVRTYRINVVREDVSTADPTLVTAGEVLYTKRGRAQVVDLPAFENDVLHALTHSGGLPGKDAQNAVWVLRAGEGGDAAPAMAALQQADDPAVLLDDENTPGLGHRTTKIPLRMLPGEPAPFRLEDVVLADGDTVFVPARDEVFFVGGLLAGGQYPYPRDRTLDVVEAIALVGGSVGGPGGASGASTAAGGRGALLPPSRVIVLRKLEDGRQLSIRVDLARALHDEAENIPILPGDVVQLYRTPGQTAGNYLLNFFTFGFGFTGN